MTWLAALIAGSSLAQGVSPDRPIVPAAGIAAESGPGAAWVNPANLAYDPDPRYGVYFTQPLTERAPQSLAATTGFGGLQVGAHSYTDLSGTFNPRWTIDYTTSVRLPDRIAIGWRIAWHLVTGSSNYVAYDVGGSWRPLPWLGLSAVARNITNPDPIEAPAQTGVGLALRPFGDFMVLGVDGSTRFGANGQNTRLGMATVRLRPVEGLYLRGQFTTDDTFTEMSAGGGIEVYFDGLGGGAALGAAGDQTVLGAWVGSDEPGESLVRSGRRVPTLQLDVAPEYQPTATLFSDPGESWLDTLELMRRVETDPGARGMLLRLSAPLSWARHQELRQRIEALEAAGKPVTVYLDGYPGTGSYWVATAASRIVMHPAATVELTGVASELLNVRGAFDMLGIEPQFVKRSEYKSAPELQTETEPSPASLEQTHALLDGLYAELVTGISTGRGRSPADAEAWIDGGPWSANEALDLGLVDELLYPDELDDDLEQTHDGPVVTRDLYDLPQPTSPWEAPSQIAIIYVDGVIVPGPSSSGGLLGGRTAGSQTLVDQLDAARNDAQVRAVVMRVDSPGGSSFASDEIWRAVTRYDGEKPIVVSMGGVAASGGYYVSAGADAIWAEPTTITGSIGVYSGWPTVGGLMDRLGVNSTTVQRGRNATIHSTSEPWDERERARMQTLVDDTYMQFKERVASGRNLTLDQVEEVARGRVWVGSDAADNGLVDGIGGLQDAIADARSRAGLPKGRDVTLVEFSAAGSAFESLSPTVIKAVFPQQEWMWTPRQRSQLRLPDELAPLLTPSLHPQERLWLIEPSLVRDVR